jgi:Transposase DDE domain
LIEKHGTSRRRSWRRLQIGIDAGSGEIVAIELTGKYVDDAARTDTLLNQIADPIASPTVDGAYDQDRVYQAVAERHPDAASSCSARSAESDPTRRVEHIQEITVHGRICWQKSSGYNVRAKVEAAIGRYKRVIGDALRSRTDETEATEVAIAARVLNQMLGLDPRSMSGLHEHLPGQPSLDPTILAATRSPAPIRQRPPTSAGIHSTPSHMHVRENGYRLSETSD